MMDFEYIEKLASLVKEKELEEIEIKSGDTAIRIKGKKCPPPPPMGMPMMPPVAAASAPVPPSAFPAAESAEGEHHASGKEVKSPLVGTFYAAPAPDKAPFVSVGQSVSKGDVLMIIESMKVMNEVTSEFDGVVKEILVHNGDVVEYDQTLMIIG